jgi:hypothetical protein
MYCQGPVLVGIRHTEDSPAKVTAKLNGLLYDIAVWRQRMVSTAADTALLWISIGKYT